MTCNLLRCSPKQSLMTQRRSAWLSLPLPLLSGESGVSITAALAVITAGVAAWFEAWVGFVAAFAAVVFAAITAAFAV
eukprot:scaffold300692_cov15-Tisochrysis_lutea.AAC.1